MPNKKMLRITAFASGRGSNLDAIYKNIDNGKLDARVVGVISNNSQSGALEKARKRGLCAYHISRRQFDSDEAFTQKLVDVLHELDTEFVILAGYMKKVPSAIINAYNNRMLNIHPALLPSFGGKGMYGRHVHEAMLNYGCKVTGVTVHLVTDEYDAGAPVIQECVPVKNDDTPDSLAERVLKVEHKVYSQAIQLFAADRVRIEGRRTIILPER